MQHSFLIEIVQKLGVNSRNEVLAFLQSPYFNRDTHAREVVTLYETLVAAAPDYDGAALDKEKMYQTIFPGKAFVPGKMDKLMTELKKMLRLFVITQQALSADNEVNQQLAWVAWLRKQNLKDRYHLAFNKLKNRKAVESLDEYRIRLEIAREAYEWESTHNHLQGDLHIPQLTEQLNLYHLAFRLDLHNRFLLQQKVANVQKTNEFDRNEADYIRESPFLGMLKQMNNLLQKDTPGSADFLLFTEFLEHNKTHIPADVIRLYSAYLRNICTLLINAGHLEYYPILHQIYKDSLAEGNLIYMGRIEANAYLNIVAIAIGAGEPDWAKEFTENYKNLIHDPHPFYYEFNTARCLFATKQYEEVLLILQKETILSSASNFYQLLVRILELKAYYELDSELLPFKMDACRKFIERTTPKAIPKRLNAMNLNFIYILNQLVQSPRKSPDRAEKILKR
ncbi:MAG: hypothetical protein SFV22_08300, partial [Saprospiraceae bacterium]|nr:hypothetical protein [Saprospiraceae bacterium]